MVDTNRRLNNEQFNDATTWDLPSVDDVISQDSSKTNALNRPSTWKYESPEIEEEVDEIEPMTAQDIETIRQAAYEEGFKLGQREGHDKGYDEGLESGRNKGIEEGSEQGLASAQAQITDSINTLTTQWQDIVSAFSNPLEQVNSELEKELMILAMKLAEAVIGVEVTQREDILLQAISEGIKVLPIEDKVYQFQMHPQDIALVVEHFGQDTIIQNNWKLIESPSIKQGGCEINTENNSVDVSIERRSKDIFSKFLIEQGVVNDQRTD